MPRNSKYSTASPLRMGAAQQGLKVGFGQRTPVHAILQQDERVPTLEEFPDARVDIFAGKHVVRSAIADQLAIEFVGEVFQRSPSEESDVLTMIQSVVPPRLRLGGSVGHEFGREENRGGEAGDLLRFCHRIDEVLEDLERGCQ